MTRRARCTSRSGGFTLVELLVVLAILTLITGTLVAIFHQIFEIPRLGNAQMTVDSDVRNAGTWLLRDANESVTFTGSGSCGYFSTGHGMTYTYTLNGTELTRQTNTGETRVVARHVSALICPTGEVDDMVDITLTASHDDVYHSMTYTVNLRVD